jgi:hypothetical protein
MANLNRLSCPAVSTTNCQNGQYNYKTIFQLVIFVWSSHAVAANVSICVRAGLPKPRLVPDNERIKDTKTLDYASTPLDANTLLPDVGSFSFALFVASILVTR